MQATTTENSAPRKRKSAATYLTVPPGALKLRQAAQYISVSPITMRRLIARGQIKSNRALRHILISIRELDRFLETDSDKAGRAA